MAKETTSGIGVNSRYGPVTVPDNAVGVIKTEGGKNQLVAEFGYEALTAGHGDEGVFVLPPNILVTAAYVEVESIVSLSAAGAAIVLGTEGSPATNGVALSGSAVAIGISSLTAKGTWASALTGTTTVALALSGGSISGGKGRFVVEYLKV